MPPANPVSSLRPQQRLSILVVDDDAEILSLLRDVLTDDGFRVLAVGSAAAAAMLLAAEAIDLLITDIDLGAGDDGLALAVDARATRPLLPVIYISGGRHFGDAGRVDGSAFIPKPFGLDTLTVAVATAMAA
ncbi:MAG: response regulator [Bauldia sp.]|nr:response regulator [Bauldia sp.]MCW5719180.1 response regulator [Bauldia sp.]